MAKKKKYTPKKRGPGRPKKDEQVVRRKKDKHKAATAALRLSPKLQKSVCDMIRKGCYIDVAAQAHGVTASTLSNWMRRGRLALKEEHVPRTEQRYVNFLAAIKKALAEAEVLDVERLDRAALSGVWQAAAWKLRHGPSKERYQEVSKHSHEHSGKDGGPIQHVTVDLDVLSLPLEVRKLLLEAMRSQKALPAPEIIEEVDVSQAMEVLAQEEQEHEQEG